MREKLTEYVRNLFRNAPNNQHNRELEEEILQNSLDREVPSSQIGAYAMEKLKKVDEVAYVRFASVYRQFRDVNSFMEELNKIIESKQE